MLQLISACSPGSAPPPPPPPDQNVRARPVISGGTLRTDTGHIIRAARMQGGVAAARDPATWAAIRAAGGNCSRFGIQAGAGHISAKFAEIDDVVEAARSNRCYVMLGNPEAGAGKFANDIAGNKAKQIETWTALAPRYKDEPHVFYEQLNEPEEWGLWSHYSDASGNPTALTVALHEVYSVMRAGAPDTVILTPSCANLQAPGGAAQYIHAMDAFNSLGVDWTKTVYSFHYYNQTFVLGLTNANATDGAVAALVQLKAAYPMVCTETNWGFVGEPGREVLIDAADAMETAGVGYSIMHYPGQVYGGAWTFPGDLRTNYFPNKLAQLRSRGFSIPVE